MYRAKTKARLVVGLTVSVISALVVVPVLAAFSLFGDASIVSGGNPGNAAQLPADTSLPNMFAGVNVSPSSPIPWTSFATLSADFNVTDDNCGGGSPRFSVGVDVNSDNVSDGNVHIAFGPSPSFTGCASGWQSTGNLIGNNDAGRYDYSNFGGSPFTTYSAAPASVLAGSVVKVTLVVDGWWSTAATGGDGEQTILVDNIDVNGVITDFEPPTSKDQCKNGGWMTFTVPHTFKNQGDCIQFVNTGK